MARGHVTSADSLSPSPTPPPPPPPLGQQSRNSEDGAQQFVFTLQSRMFLSLEGQYYTYKAVVGPGKLRAKLPDQNNPDKIIHGTNSSYPLTAGMSLNCYHCLSVTCLQKNYTSKM